MEKIESVLLSVRELTKYYGRRLVLDSVSFDVLQNEKIAIVGKSGAGKTTLLNLLGALDKKSSGEIIFKGKPIRTREMLKYRRTHVGFLFQSSFLIDEFTAEQNVASAIKLSKNGESAEKFLELVGMQEYKNAYPQKLSVGQARRVALARALAKLPDMLLLDEPTDGLDDETGLEIMCLTERLCRENNITMITVTHNMSHARRMDRILTLSNGRITEEGLY